MLRTMGHMAAYGIAAATIWWNLGLHHAGRNISTVAAAVVTVLLLALVISDVMSALTRARERRESAAAVRAVLEAERLRRRAYDLCASLRLGFTICEDCWAWHPDRATRELDRMRAAVGQFLSVDLGALG